MLTVLTWKWGTKYPLGHVARLQAGVKRHLKQPHRFVCATDDEMILSAHSSIDAVEIPVEDRPLLADPGCFCRLRMFDPEWQRFHSFDDRIVSIDLDTVVTGPLDRIFDHAERFLILMGANATNPCPVNGSLMMLRASANPHIWSEFSIERARQVTFHEFPDDQGWIWHQLPNAAGWHAGRTSGVYAFKKPGWPNGDDLPKGAKLVTFPGKRDPSQFMHLPWVQQHWRV